MSAIELGFRSELAADRSTVWAVVSTMEGVNAELGPWIRMTHPAELSSIADLDVQPGQVVHRSWLLVGGLLPIDRHALALERVLPGGGFDEESTSWLQRRWRHERRVATTEAGGCVVTDRLVVEPRLPLARPLVERVVAALFRHRHRRLVARFGSPSGQPPTARPSFQ